MKKLKYILPTLFLLGTLFFACVDDTGSYDYDDNAGVEIKFDTAGIENRLVLSYDLMPGQHVEFEPNVIYPHPERLRYRWFYLTTDGGAYRPKQEGNALVYPPADTVGYARKLDWVVDLAPGYYRFYLLAEDTVTGVRGYYQAEERYVRVAQEGNLGGLYLLCEHGNETDIDVHRSATMMIVGGDGQHLNYYSGLAGKRLPGKPKFIRGSLGSSAYLVCTEQTMVRLNRVGLQTMDTWEDMFSQTPATFNPQEVSKSYTCDYLINDGKLYTLYTDKPNSRKFSAPIAGDYEAGDYLSFAYYSSGKNGAQTIYDKKNRCFRPYYAKKSNIGSFNHTVADAIVDANHLPGEPVAILNATANQTYAILELDGTRYLYRYDFYGLDDEGDFAADGSKSITDLSNCEGISQAKYFTGMTATDGMNLAAYSFYYATDKAVYSFSPVKGGDNSAYTLYECEATEEVTAIYAGGSMGGGWPSSDCLLWLAVWDEAKQEGKLIEYEMNHTTGEPRAKWTSHDNPYITTGWGKIRSMVFLDAE
ncbi:MAG: hypothetical protein K2I90_08955 [Odoribacter sp.]|nr:hypothetical protein [Odoribacter sp.]